MDSLHKIIELLLSKFGFKGISMWLLLFVIVWLFFPSSWELFLTTKEIPPFPQGSMYFVVLFVISSCLYILFEACITKLRKVWDESSLDKQIKRDIDVLTQEQASSIAQIIHGVHTIPYTAGNILLLDKGILLARFKTEDGINCSLNLRYKEAFLKKYPQVLNFLENTK